MSRPTLMRLATLPLRAIVSPPLVKLQLPADKLQCPFSSLLVLSSKFCTFPSTDEIAISETKRSPVDNKIESRFFGVKQFGKLELKIPISVTISSLNPQTYPEMNKASICILYTGEDKDSISPTKLSALTKLYDLSVDLKEETDLTVGLVTSIQHLPLTCRLYLPLKFDIGLEVEGDVEISNMESQTIRVRQIASNGGVCKLRNVKTRNMAVLWRDGDIICETGLQGDIYLTNTGEGKIQADKLQGQNIKCETEAGVMNFSSVYSDECSFITESANVELGSCHGKCEIKVGQGNVTINSIDGDLSTEVEKGCVKAHLTRHGQVNIECREGDIQLEIPGNTETSLSLRGNTVECDERLNVQNIEKTSTDNGIKYTGHITSQDSSATIQASTHQGAVQLLCKDWFSSIINKLQHQK
ncbi:hypothetical protein ScPMuIL_009164 [Solemya velum]